MSPHGGERRHTMSNLPNLRAATIEERAAYLEACLYRCIAHGSLAFAHMTLDNVEYAALATIAANNAGYYGF
jgi:hypothetical protein